MQLHGNPFSRSRVHGGSTVRRTECGDDDASVLVILCFERVNASTGLH